VSSTDCLVDRRVVATIGNGGEEDRRDLECGDEDDVVTARGDEEADIVIVRGDEETESCSEIERGGEDCGSAIECGDDDNVDDVIVEIADDDPEDVSNELKIDTTGDVDDVDNMAGTIETGDLKDDGCDGIEDMSVATVDDDGMEDNVREICDRDTDDVIDVVGTNALTGDTKTGPKILDIGCDEGGDGIVFDGAVDDDNAEDLRGATMSIEVVDDGGGCGGKKVRCRVG
jgi:hypothetical protein